MRNDSSIASQSVHLSGLRKEFEGAVAVSSLDLDIEPGEFVTFLGPSGCGKTTTLKMIAGLLAQDAGEIRLGNRRIDRLPANRRNVGLVFQNYALFPHMTVSDNIAFGLRMRRWSSKDISQRVAELLQLVRLEGLGDRKPSQLSGGQQQRVAVARALAFYPSLVLLDEPLSNLDAKLREQVRLDIRDIQRRTGQTTVFVTHDQEEALVMSDRIVLMNNGVVEQVGRPEELYSRPSTEFASRFIGASNLFKARMSGVSKVTAHTESGREFELSSVAQGVSKADSAWLCVRPEDVEINPGGSGIAGSVAASVVDMVFQGPSVTLKMESAELGEMTATKATNSIGELRVGDVCEVEFARIHAVPVA